MEDLLRDLRIGMRQLARSPGFTLAAVFALTLGIGATCAMLTVVNAVLLEALPYKDPDRLVMLTGRFREGAEVREWPISQKDLEDWQKRNQVFEDLSAFTPDPLSFNLLRSDEAERLNGELVSESYFRVLGIEPVLGRFFTPEEDRDLYAHAVVVLAHDLWRSHFGADPAIVGQTIDLSGRRYLVVGVGPAGFHGLTDRAQFWVPTMMPPGPDFYRIRRFRWVSAIGRLLPGVSLEQAQDGMDAVAAGLEKEFPDTNRGMGVEARLLQDAWFGKLRRGLSILTGGAVIILLIACTNVAGLLLSRTVIHQRTVAIRSALGAGRGRLVRQLLTESVLLALFGAALGVALALASTRALVAASGVHFQSFIGFGLDPAVLCGVLAVTLACGVGFGLVPVWVTSRVELTQTLQQQGKQPPKGFGRQRFQSSVVVAQVALALLLLIGAGLMAKGFRSLLSEDLGFQPDELLTMRVDLKGEKYADDEPVIVLLRELLEGLTPTPGVASLAIAGPAVPTDDWVGGYVSIEGLVSEAPNGTFPMMMHGVSPEYFSTLGIPILKGRVFTREDTQYGVVVSKTMAEQYWPGEDPIGKRLKIGAVTSQYSWLTVWGVAGEVKHQGPMGNPRPAPDLYMSNLQFPLRLPLTLNVLARPAGGLSARSLAPVLKTEVAKIAPDLPVYDIATMEERIERQTEQGRFQVLLIGIFTFLALTLAAIGIYAVVAYSVAQRTRELSIRMAAGAGRRDVVMLVVGRGALLALVGVVLGLASAMALGRFLTDLLYGVSATDPLILGGTSLLLFAVALIASFIPARRAGRLDPALGLRAE